MISESPRLHLETVTPFMLQSLRAILQEPAFDSFQLAGGTSIALLTGHRQSIDLDLFTNHPIKHQEIDMIIGRMRPLTAKQTQIGIAYELPSPNGGAALKLDFCNWRTPFLYPPVVIDSLRLTDLRDSCADKLNAVVNRDELKDVWDIAELLKHHTLAEMIGFYRQKHPFLNAKEPIQALAGFDYNKPVGFRVYNGETLTSIRARIEDALRAFHQKPVQEKPLTIPEGYREKLAQKGIKPADLPAAKPKGKGPRL
jgi:hypothetical protein